MDRGMNRYHKVAPMLMVSTLLVLIGVLMSPGILLLAGIDLARIANRLLSSGGLDISFSSGFHLFQYPYLCCQYPAFFIFAVNQILSELVVDADGVTVKDLFWKIRIPWTDIASYVEKESGGMYTEQSLVLRGKVGRVNRGILKIPLGWIRVNKINLKVFGPDAIDTLRQYGSNHFGRRAEG
jgi:hypothetical protein